MRFIKNWRVALIIGMALIAIPIAAHVNPTDIAAVEKPQIKLSQQAALYKEEARTAHINSRSPVTARRATLPQVSQS